MFLSGPRVAVICGLLSRGALHCAWSCFVVLYSSAVPGVAAHCASHCVARFFLGLILSFCVFVRPQVLVQCASLGHEAFYCSWSCFSFRFSVQLPGWRCIVYCICMPRFVVPGLVLLFCVTVRSLGGGVLRIALA